MPEYLYLCPACGRTASEVLPISQHQYRPVCGCGARMQRDWGGEGGKANRPFPVHYSPVHGKVLRSWSEYHAENKRLGLIDIGEKPEKLPRPGRRVAASYVGQRRAE